jgi:uncharacterized spore protein YtfJ
MTDENALPPEELDKIELNDATGVVQDTLDKFLDSANVYAVYGEPVKHGDTTIIPTAEVLSFMGFGVGYGTGPSQQPGDTNQPSGGGGGGGGRVFSRPVAVVIASPEGVRVEPVVDVTKIALAAFTTGGFMIGMIARMLRPRRRLQS